jgi:O-antigen/teichoic acid export membrane protein
MDTASSFMPSNTKRIAKNTLALYFRQILIMLVSLYTVRVVLNTLGAEDYGIYNVVAGAVTMLGFLSNAMATASQRYFSFELGRNNFEQLQKVFGLTLIIYVLIGLFVLLLAETIGLWFVYNKLVIPDNRRMAVSLIYQCSVFSFLLTMITVPYMASIISHEDMNIYAYVSIIDAILRLLVVYLLMLIHMDKLILYGILMCTVTFINTAIYRIICAKKYAECRFKPYWNYKLVKELMSYAGWNLFGATTGLFKNQAVNILLNIHFTPVINAARAISAQVNTVVNYFADNFTTAMRPQIIKDYALGNEKKMLELILKSSKITYFIVFIFSMPIFFEIPYILQLWLKSPPEYTIVFARLALLDALFDSASHPIKTMAQAIGKIKLYQSVVGGIRLLNLPVSYIVLKLGYAPYSVGIIAVIITIISFGVRLLIVKRLINFSIFIFIKQVILPVVFVSIISAIFPALLLINMDIGLYRLCLVVVSSIVMGCLCVYSIGLTKAERSLIKIFLHPKKS